MASYTSTENSSESALCRGQAAGTPTASVGCVTASGAFGGVANSIKTAENANMPNEIDHTAAGGNASSMYPNNGAPMLDAAMDTGRTMPRIAPRYLVPK